MVWGVQIMLVKELLENDGDFFEALVVLDVLFDQVTTGETLMRLGVGGVVDGCLIDVGGVLVHQIVVVV